MINREEIKRLVNVHRLGSDLDFVWNLYCIKVPELSLNDLKGEECRLSLAEHIIHRFFESETAENLPGGAFAAFCERFQANERDMAAAKDRTSRDFEDAGTAFTDADIATTMIWLWLGNATEKYGICDVEFKYFLYLTIYMVKGDQELKRVGKRNLMADIVTNPNLVGKILAYMLIKNF